MKPNSLFMFYQNFKILNSNFVIYFLNLFMTLFEIKIMVIMLFRIKILNFDLNFMMKQIIIQI